jgi:hypothetical protein
MRNFVDKSSWDKPLAKRKFRRRGRTSRDRVKRNIRKRIDIESRRKRALRPVVVFGISDIKSS